MLCLKEWVRSLLLLPPPRIFVRKSSISWKIFEKRVVKILMLCFLGPECISTVKPILPNPFLKKTVETVVPDKFSAFS